MKTNPVIASLPGKDIFQKLLMDASYHYADDSGSEWGTARSLKDQAAQVAIENRWRYWQIVEAHRECEPLVTLEDVMESVCKIAYREKG